MFTRSSSAESQSLEPVRDTRNVQQQQPRQRPGEVATKSAPPRDIPTASSQARRCGARALRKGHVQPKRMHQRTLHNLIQRRAGQMLRARGTPASEAAIEARKYSTHSLRRGALTSMGKGGATLAELIDLGRHSQKSASVVPGYIEPGHAGARAMRKLRL